MSAEAQVSHGRWERSGGRGNTCSLTSLPACFHGPLQLNPIIRVKRGRWGGTAGTSPP